MVTLLPAPLAPARLWRPWTYVTRSGNTLGEVPEPKVVKKEPTVDVVKEFEPVFVTWMTRVPLSVWDD